MASRRPAVAGQFYPADAQQLERVVKQYLDEATVEPAPDNVAAIVTPHAGYMFSGPTAGFAFARVRGKKPKRVILLGSSHRYPVGTASVCVRGAFETPLGSFPIDKSFAAELARHIKSESDAPHMLEHALEVQLPFLWLAFGKVPIVPVLFGGRASALHMEIGTHLADMIDDTDLVVASTDLSHYLREEQANAIDKHTIDTILQGDPETLQKELEAECCSLCGGTAVTAAMAFAKARNCRTWSLLDYRTSGAVSHDYDRVVGYAALSMEDAS